MNGLPGDDLIRARQDAELAWVCDNCEAENIAGDRDCATCGEPRP